MTQSTNGHPRIERSLYGCAKNKKVKRDCTTCEHEIGYACGHKLEGTNKHDKMVDDNLSCYALKKFKKKNNNKVVKRVEDLKVVK